jgi:LPS-assembly lipoprotein
MTNMMRLLLLAAILSLTACGFHLRGSNLQDVTFAFKSLYLKTPSETPFVVDLRRALKANKITLAQTADQADLVLEIVSEQSLKQILSLSGTGRVQEYQLFYRVSLRAYDNKQVNWLPADDISLSRIFPYDDTQVLAKQQEEATLYKDMRSDAVGQTIRRLLRAKPQLDAQ